MAQPDATTAPLGAAATAAALDDSAVVRWWQVTAFLEVAGPDAPALLDGLCTQAVERIAPGTATLGLFLDAKARIIAPAILHRLADEPWHAPRRDATVDAAPVVLLETLPELVEPLRAHLARFRLRALATIEPRDVSAVAVVGATAAGVPAPDTGSWSTLLHEARPTRAWLGRSGEEPAAVTAALAAACAGLADPDAIEAARIDAGIPGLHDLLPGRMPAEVGGMERAVALDAGCYLGQEPVARLHYRGRANRTLRRVATDAPPVPGPDQDPDLALALRAAGAAPDARPVGRLTSWATDPDGRTRGLAVLRRELEPGDELRLPAGDARLVVVDAAPT